MPLVTVLGLPTIWFFATVVLILKSPQTQIASGPTSLEQGESALALGGRFDHGVLSAQLYPVLANYHVLSVNSPDHDSVARMGSVYGLLDRLTRPNDRALRSGGADPRPKYHPACHQQGQSHGGQQQ